MLSTSKKQMLREKLLDDIILTIIDLILVFCATFSSEKTVYEIPVFFIFWLIIVVFRRNFILEKLEILVQVFSLVALLPILIQFYKYDFPYYFAAIEVILYVNVIIFANHLVNRLLSNSPGSKLVRWLPAILLFLLGVFTQRLSGDDPRQSLVFGPNVYYRIIGVIFLLHLILFYDSYAGTKEKTSIFNLGVTILALMVAIYIMIKTGSRGAIIVGCFMLLSFIYTVISIKSKKIKMGILIAIILVLLLNIVLVLLLNIDLINFDKFLNENRSFWFYDRGASSSSISEREAFLKNTTSFFLKDDYLLGEGSDYIYAYPHNLYVDLLYNGGIFPCLVLLTNTVMYGIILWRWRIPHNWKILTLVLSPIYIGALFSGTLYNNYPVISLIIIFPIWMLNQVPKKG